MFDSFSVQGFRGFAKKTAIRFDRARHYDFNEGLVKDGRVKHALLYGPNGCGKSSLTEAIMDIQINRNLVRGQGVSLMGNPNSFLNGDCEKEATFRYEFSFEGGGKLIYEYGKPSFFEVAWERMSMDGETVLDRKGPEIKCHIPGTENVNFRSMAPNVSAFFYLANFLSFPEDSIYGQLVDFVDRMLWFRSLLQGNESQSGAIVPGPEFITDVIARDGRIKELEKQEILE